MRCCLKKMSKKLTKANSRPKQCAICNDEAIGINFNAPTCMSCRAFFRRNAFRLKEMKCAFSDSCHVDIITRKFCTKCRLQKCFEVGMKKEWILDEQEKRLYREKIIQNRIKREEKYKAKLKKLQLKQMKQNSKTRHRKISKNSQKIDQKPISKPKDLLEKVLNEADIILSESQSSGKSDENAESLDNLANEQYDDDISLLMNAIDDSSIMLSVFDDLRALDSEQMDSFQSLESLSVDLENDVRNNSWSITNLDNGETIGDGLECSTVPFEHDFHKDFIYNYLISNQEDSTNSDEDPLVESLNQISSNDFGPIFHEIGFPVRELILPEKCLIKELLSACSSLDNPYQRILEYGCDYNREPHLAIQHSMMRFVQMCGKLDSFRSLAEQDQQRMLKCRTLELLGIRSAMLYHPDREAWCFLDDEYKSSIMIPLRMIEPFCQWEFKRHLAFPSLFRHEWLKDGIITNLLIIIVLFTPRPEYLEYDRIKEEHLRYRRLLSRYLEVKYPTFTEADDSFRTLLSTIGEMRLLIIDVVSFFTQNLLTNDDTRQFVEIVELQRENSTKWITESGHSKTRLSVEYF